MGAQPVQQGEEIEYSPETDQSGAVYQTAGEQSGAVDQFAEDRSVAVEQSAEHSGAVDQSAEEQSGSLQQKMGARHSGFLTLRCEVRTELSSHPPVTFILFFTVVWKKCILPKLLRKALYGRWV